MSAIKGQLGGGAIQKTLAALGDELGPGHRIEIVVVGGAAGLLTGVLPSTITTADVDAIHFRPPGDVEAVLAASESVAEKLGVARGWLSVDAGIYSNALPEGWESRQVDIGRFGRLQVYALGRLDLIGTKFYAYRGGDLEHLAQMKVSPAERRFVGAYLRGLRTRLPSERSKIEMALRILREWRS
jgi:hypothetical protein